MNVTCPQHESCSSSSSLVIIDVKSVDTSATLSPNDDVGGAGTKNSTTTNLIDDNKSKSIEQLEEEKSAINATIVDTTPTTTWSNNEATLHDKIFSISMLSDAASCEPIVINCNGDGSTAAAVLETCQPTNNNLALNVPVSCEKKVDDGDNDDDDDDDNGTNNNMSQMSANEEVLQQQQPLIEFEERIILGIENNTDTKSNIEVVEHCEQDKDSGKQQETTTEQEGKLNLLSVQFYYFFFVCELRCRVCSKELYFFSVSHQQKC